MVLLSDLLVDPETTRTALRFLRHRGHEVLVFHLIDPGERELPAAGDTRLYDPETEEELNVNIADVRAAYREAVKDALDEWDRGLRPHGIDYVVVGTDYMHIYLYDAKGNVLWGTETTGKVLEACVSNNGDYIGYMTDDSRIYFVVKNSRVIWEYHFNRQPLWIDMVGTADFVVVGETPRKVSIFSKSGRRTWSFKLQAPGTIGRLADSGGNILVSGRNGEVTMLGIEAYLARLLRQAQRLVERTRAKGFDAHEAEQQLYAAERALEDGAHQEFLDTVARAKNAAQEAPVARKAVAETAGGGDSCGNCGAENLPGFKFCGSCGQKLAQGCPSCGTQLQPGFQFCGNCGAQH